MKVDGNSHKSPAEKGAPISQKKNMILFWIGEETHFQILHKGIQSRLQWPSLTRSHEYGPLDMSSQAFQALGNPTAHPVDCQKVMHGRRWGTREVPKVSLASSRASLELCPIPTVSTKFAGFDRSANSDERTFPQNFSNYVCWSWTIPRVCLELVSTANTFLKVLKHYLPKTSQLLHSFEASSFFLPAQSSRHTLPGHNFQYLSIKRMLRNHCSDSDMTCAHLVVVFARGRSTQPRFWIGPHGALTPTPGCQEYIIRLRDAWRGLKISNTATKGGEFLGLLTLLIPFPTNLPWHVAEKVNGKPLKLSFLLHFWPLEGLVFSHFTGGFLVCRLLFIHPRWPSICTFQGVAPRLSYQEMLAQKATLTVGGFW